MGSAAAVLLLVVRWRAGTGPRCWRRPWSSWRRRGGPRLADGGLRLLVRHPDPGGRHRLASPTAAGEARWCRRPPLPVASPVPIGAGIDEGLKLAPHRPAAAKTGPAGPKLASKPAIDDRCFQGQSYGPLGQLAAGRRAGRDGPWPVHPGAHARFGDGRALPPDVMGHLERLRSLGGRRRRRAQAAGAERRLCRRLPAQSAAREEPPASRATCDAGRSRPGLSS